VAEAMRGVITLSRQHYGDDRHAHQPGQRGHLDRDIDDDDRRRGALDPSGDRGHPVAQARMPERRPVQLSAGGGFDRSLAGVVAREPEPLAGPAFRAGQRGQPGNAVS